MVSLFIIPLAGTLVCFVPPPRPKAVAHRDEPSARRALLVARLKQTASSFHSGDFQNGLIAAQRGYQDALAAREYQIASRFLGNAGSFYFATHQYRDALREYQDARSLAEKAHDDIAASTWDLNISSVYTQLGEIDAALAVARQGLARLPEGDRNRRLPPWLLQLAALYADQGRMRDALVLYRQGIAAADHSNDPEMVSFGWNDIGFVYLQRKQLRESEPALLEGYRIRRMARLRSIESSYENLGILRLEQNDIPAAARLLDAAMEQSRRPGGLNPEWQVFYARGRVRLAQNRLTDALADLRIAAAMARNWRRSAPPVDAIRISAERSIQKVHAELIEAGNRLYFETHDPAFARETFESAEANRAASLRALLAEPRDWRSALPPEYWNTLRQLESEEAEALHRTDPHREHIQQLQSALMQWESRAGSNTDAELPGLLERTQRNLPDDAALFAFHLAPVDSYLWAVTRSGFALYRLPAEAAIRELAERFTESVRDGGAEMQSQGAQLFTALFGPTGAGFQSKPHWLLALDAQLFDIPFAALVVEKHGQEPVFLAERHSLQIVSGAGLVRAPRPRAAFSGPFIAVADPIYNMADPRWSGRRPTALLGIFAASAGETTFPGDVRLARLPASAREAASCAGAWADPAPPVLLEGAAASRRQLRAALDRRPAVIHFATHVVHSSEPSSTGLIVLSLTPGGQHEVLGPAEIATWNLDNAVVSLSGCSSGAAAAVPGAGLMGLTRACLAAGARAVIGSRWPTPDDAGALFLSFYRHLRDAHAAQDSGAATALQLTQIDMLRSKAWRSNPRYWSAYFVTGNQQ